MNRHRFVLLIAMMFGALPSVVAAQATPPKAAAPRIPFEMYKLANGLTVILSVDHNAPVIAVDVEHHVGSKNEEVGRTGFAHLFEHVMFNGSQHAPYGSHNRLVEGAGGSWNGSTNSDKTNFYEDAPSNNLETLIWLESDRFGWLLPTLDRAKMNLQQDVVKSERRQSYDNVPYGRVGEIMDAQMYPEGHPYHWPVIGSMADLSAASLDDVVSFYKKWYGPGNAVLVITGDFNPVQAKGWVQKYFGEIPGSPTVKRPVVPPAHLDAPKRLTYEDNVAAPQLYIAWPGVGLASADRAALTVMGSILSGDRTQGLAKEFVYDRKWATSIRINASLNENAGTIDLTVTPAPGTDLTKLESAIDSAIASFKAEGPTANQIKKATAGAQYSQYAQLESMLGKAQNLAGGWIYAGDPGWSAKNFARALAVTTADVKRVANSYLGANRIVLSAVPMGKRELASHAAESVLVTSPFASKQEVGQ